MNLPAPSLSYVLSNRLPVKAFLVWFVYVAALLLWHSYKFRFAHTNKLDWLTRSLNSDLTPAILSGFYFSVQSIPLLGDSTYLIQIWQKQLNIVWASEPISHFLLTKTFSPFLLSKFVPPVMGAVSMWLWLKLPVTAVTRRMSQSSESSLIILFRILFFASAPVQMIFYRGYFETLMIFIPFSLLYIYFLLRYVILNEAKPVASFMTTVGTLGIAMSVHGVAFVWLPVLPILLQRFWLRPFASFRFYGFLLAIIFPVFIYGIILVLFSVAGYKIDWLNMGGGGDGSAFVPIYGLTEWANYSLYWFGSIQHIWSVVSILIYSALFLIVITILYFLNGRPRFNLSKDTAVRFLLFGGFLGFIVFWNFDLGFFYDFDLIFSLSLSVGLVAELMVQNYKKTQYTSKNQKVENIETNELSSNYNQLLKPSLFFIVIAVIQTSLWLTAFSRFF